jgi:hypothetical protein
VLRRTFGIDNRRRVHAHVAVLKTAERRTACPPCGQSSVKRAEIGPEDFGRPHDVVKVRTDNVITARPFAQAAVAPKDGVIFAQQRDAVRHSLKNAFVLHEPGGIDDFRKMIGVRVDADIFAAAEVRERANRRHLNDVDFLAEALAEGNLGVVRAAQTEDLGTRTRPLSAGCLI